MLHLHCLFHRPVFLALCAYGLNLAWLDSAHAQRNLSDATGQRDVSNSVDNSVGSAVNGAAEEVPNDALVALGRNDASLNEIAIVSEDRLAAVGDRGTILISGNGGRSWEATNSPTTAGLHGIQFSPLGFGLIVGGWIGADTRSSHAVVLQTLNGGKNWSTIATPDLPRLIGLCILENHCVAWGDYSPTWRTSVFESLDAGLTWRGIPTSLGHATAAGISDAGAMAIVDQLGRSFLGNVNSTGNSTGRQTVPTQLASPTRPLRCVLHTGERWLACGASGELIWSVDGSDWTDVEYPLSRGARELCHWEAIEQVGNQLWICGRPGSIVLHSDDAGASWSVQRTGQTLPLSAIRFVDLNRGWATGPLGLILATRDGGQTWYAQRQRARRLGLLALSASANEIPWSALVAATWDEQIAAAASVFQSPEPIEQADFLPSRNSLRKSVAPQMGLASCELISEPFTNPERLIEQLSVELLSWRPDVLLVSASEMTPDPIRNDDIRSNIASGAMSILQQCAAPNSRLTDELHLPAWNVSKLVSTCQSDSAQFKEHSSRVLRQPGIAIGDCLLPLSIEDRQRAASVMMRTEWAHSQSRSAFASLLGAIAPNPETERQVAIRNVGNYQLMMGSVHRAQSMQQLAETPTVDCALDQWTKDLDFVMRGVPARETAPLLQQLAQRLHLGLRWEKRQIVYQRLIESSPHADTADWGRIELLRLQHSDERAAWERNVLRSDSSALQLANGTTKPRPVPPASLAAHVEPWNASPFGDSIRDSQSADAPFMVVPASAETPVKTANADYQSSATQTAWRQLLQSVGYQSPTLLMRPDIQLRLYRTGCNRSIADTNDGAQIGLAGDTSQLEHLLQAPQLIGWTQMAAQELAMADNRSSQLRWAIDAIITDQPPLLDGALDDACWSQAPTMPLTTLDIPQESATALAETKIRWAYDREYLYIGISSPHQMGSSPPSVVQRRGYDADLSEVDHVQLVLDTDRDYCTAIELAVSADGRTYDRCCGSSHYNPKWHVSVQSAADSWSAELAIELNELTTQTELPGKAWAVSARRLHPTGVSQSWSQLRSHNPYLHAGGLLIFAQ